MTTVMVQTDWRRCSKCYMLFFNGAIPPTRCPAGGAHNGQFSQNYGVPFGALGFWQPGWRWCKKCGVLFFGLNASKGVCPAGGAHDPSSSGDYTLGNNLNAPVSLDWRYWRWCSKCQGLFYEKGLVNKCPAGMTHNVSGSAEYTVFGWGW